MNPTLHWPLWMAPSALGALFVWLVPHPHARSLATGTTALTLGLALLVPMTGPRVDASTTTALILTSLLALCTVIASPRPSTSRNNLVALLLTQGAALGLLLATDPRWKLGLFIAMGLPWSLPFLREEPTTTSLRPWRATRLYWLLATVPPLVALTMALLSATPSALAAPHTWRAGLCALVLLGVCTRLAVAPLHGWLPLLMTRGPLVMAALWMNVLVSLQLLTRFLPSPTTPHGAFIAPMLESLGAASALYGALLALVQVDLRRMLAFLVVSQSGMLLAGAAAGTPAGLDATWLQGLAASVAFCGLELLTRALEARTGTTDMRRLGGLTSRAPRMATLFLLLCLAGLGLPGTLAFTSEDLLLRGTLGVHPWRTLPLLPALALNAITLLRAFHRTFLGPTPEARGGAPIPLQDLLPRERWTLTALVLVLALTGLGPSLPRASPGGPRSTALASGKSEHGGHRMP
ncbi:proton-conducting transporter membrane subunit [Myxococcus fulvus]|uniref:proton-conducting transporter transmembrane domain-containing protein n=1 Tax=Myxococcus fulvus TaxID=33 RepID=UPI003B99942D